MNTHRTLPTIEYVIYVRFTQWRMSMATCRLQWSVVGGRWSFSEVHLHMYECTF